MADLVDIYHDTGCEVSTKCLECPLPQCKYDDPRYYTKYLKQQADQGVIDRVTSMLLSTGKSREQVFDQVARELGITKRTIYRIVARSKE